MERRTQPGYEYHSCDFMDEGVYIDMNLLREYEDTGLTPEQIRDLKERDMHKKIEIYAGVATCPVCGRRVVRCYDFCPDCGQRLKWRKMKWED